MPSTESVTKPTSATTIPTDAKADATPSAPPASAVKAEDKPANPVKAEASSFSLSNLSNYTVKLGLGPTKLDFGNGQGTDHGGTSFGIAGGVTHKYDDYTLAGRLFYNRAEVSKDLGEGVVSEAYISHFGVEADLGRRLVSDWLSAHIILDLGAARYIAEESTVYTGTTCADGSKGTDGSKGAEFNGISLLFPLHENAIHLSLGAQLCAWGDAICGGVGYVKDYGVNPSLKTCDGAILPPQGLSPGGYKAGVEVDLLRVVDNFRGNGRKDKIRPRPPEYQGPLVGTGTPAKPDEKAAPVPAPGLKGVDYFKDERGKTEKYAETATKAAKDAEVDEAEVKKATDPAVARGFASSAVTSFRNSVDAMHAAQAITADLKGKTVGLSGDDKAAALIYLKGAEASAKAAEKQAGLAWDHASRAVKAYEAKRGNLEPVDFPDTRPGEAAVRRPVTAAKPDAAAKKDAAGKAAADAKKEAEAKAADAAKKDAAAKAVTDARKIAADADKVAKAAANNADKVAKAAEAKAAEARAAEARAAEARTAANKAVADQGVADRAAAKAADAVKKDTGTPKAPATPKADEGKKGSGGTHGGLILTNKPGSGSGSRQNPTRQRGAAGTGFGSASL